MISPVGEGPDEDQALHGKRASRARRWIPGERWELEFFEDGTVELERFVSAGVEAEPAAAEKLLDYFNEERPAD